MPTPPPDQRYVLLRHGQSQANVLGLIASAPSHAAAGFGLTAEGREQVRRAAREALRQGLVAPGSRIVSSPLLRARESAEVAAELLGADVQVDERLTERGFGELELGPDARYEDVWAADRDDPAHRRWGVESVESVLARAIRLIADLESGGPAGRFVLCTHGDVASTLLCAATGFPLNRHRDLGATANAEIRALPLRGLAGPLAAHRLSR